MASRPHAAGRIIVRDGAFRGHHPGAGPHHSEVPESRLIAGKTAIAGGRDQVDRPPLRTGRPSVLRTTSMTSSTYVSASPFSAAVRTQPWT
jgi:hypothetical protein